LIRLSYKIKLTNIFKNIAILLTKLLPPSPLNTSVYSDYEGRQAGGQQSGVKTPGVGYSVCHKFMPLADF
jgi:hypothetical protein